MFRDISWSQFAGYMVGALVVYYVLYLLRFHRRGLPPLFKGPKPGDQLPPVQTTHPSDPQEVELLFLQAMELSEQIKGIFQEVVYQEGDTDLLFFHLQNKVNEHQGFYRTPFMVAINNLIQMEAEKYQFKNVDGKRISDLWHAKV